MNRSLRCRLALTSLALLTLAGVTTAQAVDPGAVFRDACRAEVEGDHATAFSLYQDAATEGGLPEAMFALGRFHRDGLATTPDPEAAFRWFQKAAERGHALARFELGLAYRDGRGTDQDLALAREWLEAAALRHGPAAFALFQLVEDSEHQGVWLRRAAELGESRAMKRLSQAYASGAHGLALSPAESHRWHERAAAIENDDVRE